MGRRRWQRHPLWLIVGATVLAACSATESHERVGDDSPVGAGGGQGAGDSGGGSVNPACVVPPDTDDGVVASCEQVAPADSFDPVIQWQWTAPIAHQSFSTGSVITPLVGNFTDDNDDGNIDLCDTPDILAGAITRYRFGQNGTTVSAEGRYFLLSGDTGAVHYEFAAPADGLMYPAFADIDGDALPEIVTADTEGHLMAFEHDGSVKWISPTVGGYRTHLSAMQCPTIAIYDLDGDGTVEIIMGFEVFDAFGNRLWGVPGNAIEHDGNYWCVTPTAADLDGDGKLEVLFGHQTYHHDGQLFWTSGEPPSHPHVANFDDDDDPEVLLTNTNGMMLLEHDGTVKFGPVRPTAPEPGPNCWGKPAVVHDFNGDGIADVAASTCTDYTVYGVGAGGVTLQWTNDVVDMSGLATATAFDFLGDGTSEAIYADETQVYVFDGLDGSISLSSPRSSGTLIEYPVVADVDNDGSAEIVYVSNYNSGDGPAITVLRDRDDRWIPARRIWNQYSYHVTNVREDGTIPRQMKKSWLNLNTYRTNSQISPSGDCAPPIR
jgi:hypothetical protein